MLKANLFFILNNESPDAAGVDLFSAALLAAPQSILVEIPAVAAATAAAATAAPASAAHNLHCLPFMQYLREELYLHVFRITSLDQLQGLREKIFPPPFP